jgi:hypothetical protein
MLVSTEFAQLAVAQWQWGTIVVDDLTVNVVVGTFFANVMAAQVAECLQLKWEFKS